MQITVLGTGAAFPRPGSACSGFLVRGEEATVWMDAGNGTFARLQEHVPYQEIDVVLLSHSHGDHTADMIPFMYALGYDCPGADPVPVHSPPDVPVFLRAQLGEASQEIFDGAFDFQSLDGALEIGDLTFEPFRTVHPVETYGFRISDRYGLVVYTADTAVFPELADSCRGADILIAEATYVEPFECPDGIHMWGAQTGQLAKDAEARRMLITHVWGSIPVDDAVREASESWDGPVEPAGEGKTYMP